MTTQRRKKLLLFIQQNSLVSSKSKQQLVSIKSDRQKYGILYIVSQSKKAFFDLSRFFAHENHLYPISISKIGQLEQYKTKLDLYAVVEPSLEPTYVHVKVVDGATFAEMNLPRCNKQGATKQFSQGATKHTADIMILNLQREYQTVQSTIYNRLQHQKVSKVRTCYSPRSERFEKII